MGLAASQARLLTITSRMSNNELRQQRIAMDKMRLASDSDKVSQKYSEALNNQTLKMSDGTKEIPLTYDNLKPFGYEVRRTSDGYTTKNLEKPNPANYPKALDVTKVPEGKKWENSLKNIIQQYGEYPTTKTGNIQQIFANATVPSIDNNEWTTTYKSNATALEQSASETSAEIGTSLLELLQKQEYDKVIQIASDGKDGGVPTEMAQQNIQAIANSLITSITQTLGISNNSVFQSETQKFLEELKAGIVGYQDKNKHTQHGKAAVGALKDANNGIIGNGTSKGLLGGSERDEYFLNVSELARRLVAIALNTNGGQNYTLGTAPNSSKIDLNLSQSYSVTSSSKGLTQAQWEQQAQKAFNSGNYSMLTWNDALNIAKGSVKIYEPDSSGKITTDYDKALADYNARTDLQSQLQSNPQFLIQGLLSGYFVLMKDGQQVSLTSDTKFLTEYDKSDDAAAEAEYKSQIAKINRKEKLLDNQAKRLDTEYSALSTELETIKSIISTHASKDFSLFS